MKELLPGSDSLANRISFYHLLLLLVSLPFDMFYSHIILISYCVHTIIQLKKGNIKPVLTARVLAVQAVFVVAVIATIYTAYPQQAYTEWGRDAVLIIFPLLFCVNPLDIKRYRSILLLLFSVCCTLTVFYLYANAIITVKHYNLPLKTIFSNNFTNHNFSQPINMHATFFSMQLVIALVFLLYVLLNHAASTLLKVIYSLCCLLLLAGLIQLGSKSILIVLFLIFNLAFPYCLPTRKKRLRYLSVTLAVSGLILLGIFFNGTLRNRYVDGMQTDLSQLQPGQNSEPRLARWEVMGALIKSSPIIGHGSGSELPILHNEFFKHKFYNSYLAGLNAHNQYLSFLIKSGVLGLIIYLLVLAYGFKIAIAKKDVLFISFILTIAIVSLSENVLDVDKGIFFYAFFFAFFLFSATPDAPLKKRREQSEIFSCYGNLS